MSTPELTRPMPANWWLRKRSLLLYMAREVTAVFAGAYSLFLVLVVARAGDAASLDGLFDILRNPVSVVLHVAVLAMVLFHTITWLILTARAVVLWRGERRVGPAVIAVPYLTVWAAVAAVVLLVALR